MFLFLRKLVQYCALKGYLRRVRDYRISLNESGPVNNTNGNSDGTEITAASKGKLKKTLLELCDGALDSDSLACLGHGK
jgi:hypothetical protein